ncbi:PREDICTED: uncharacterized protein LOC106815078 [Priapulus caudatus]|uniref:Uncharacterized protein LOC106815078 n=1 Tax=Priapulus caudatus TaxID=37621 RepID=A0ABM1ES17_PRICU|nr:PREDICTED: uncharacterized protein LOC106815078 [Priapulus caudatus]
MATSVMPAAGKKKRRRKRKRKRKSKKNKTGEESEGQLEITELDNNSDGMSPSSDDGSEEGLVTDPKTDGVVIVENVRADCYKPIEVIVHETDDSLWWDEDIDVINRKTITNVAEYEEISGIDNMVSVDLWDEEAEEQRCPSIEEEFNAIEMTDYGKKHNPRLPRPDSGFQDDDVVLSSIETEMEVLAATRRADRADSGVQSDGDSECEINTDEQQQQHMSKYPAIFDDDDDDEEVFNVKTQTSIVEKILSKTKGEKSRLIVGKEDEIMPGCCVPGCTIL